jgi:flagellar basal-body rod protein FlgC
MDFSKSMAVAASGMRAQTDRMKTIAENIANANSTSPIKGGDPYRRKIATIKPDFDRELDATLVKP